MPYSRAYKTVLSPADLPQGEHYAILEFDTLYVPAEGHGYPAYTEPCSHYLAFANREDWEDELKARMGSGKSFKAMVVQPVVVSFQTSVKVETKVSK